MVSNWPQEYVERKKSRYSMPTSKLRTVLKSLQYGMSQNCTHTGHKIDCDFGFDNGYKYYVQIYQKF